MPLFTKPQFNSVWAATGTRLAPDNAKISQGWIVEIPPHEYENWSQNRQDALLAHVNQVGVPMWDATVEYQAGKSYIQGTTSGTIYRAVTTNTNVNPELDIQGNWVVAFEAQGAALLKAQNLADVPDKAAARTNLGIPDTVFYDGRYLRTSQNLADVPNKSTARNNLGLGNSATLNVGTTSNTVASGDDSRIVNAVPRTRQVVAGVGLSQNFSNLAQDLTVFMGTPSTISSTSSNSASGTTHTHSLDIDSFFATKSLTLPGFQAFPGGFKICWGVLPLIPDGGSAYISFPSPFNNTCFAMIPVGDTITLLAEAGHFAISELSNVGCRVYWNATVTVSSGGRWVAIGY